jgi:hypothetical protein
MTTKIHIGLDVHKNSIVAAYAHGDGSPPVHHGKWSGTNLSVERGLTKLLAKLGVGRAEVSICYDCPARQGRPPRRSPDRKARPPG